MCDNQSLINNESPCHAVQEMLEQLRTTVTLAQQNDSHKHTRSNQRAGGQADEKSAAPSSGTEVEGENQGEGVATEDSNALGSSAGAEGEETGILGQDSTAGELILTKFVPMRVHSSALALALLACPFGSSL